MQSVQAAYHLACASQLFASPYVKSSELEPVATESWRSMTPDDMRPHVNTIGSTI